MEAITRVVLGIFACAVAMSIAWVFIYIAGRLFSAGAIRTFIKMSSRYRKGEQNNG